MPLKLVRARKNDDGPWYVRGTIRGRRIEESTGTRERKTAEEYRARREGELLDEAIHGRSAVATFAHAAASYLEFGGANRFLTRIIRHFGQTRLSKVDQSAVDACAKTLYPKGKSSTLIRQVYTPVSAVMTHAAARGMCAKSTLERPSPPKGKTRWLTVDEAGRLINGCSPHLRPLVVFLLYTGARASEAIYLEWREVDLSSAQVRLLDTKNGEDRGVPLHPLALSVLANLKGREGRVFRRPDGEPYEDKEDGGGQFKTAFRTATRRAGLGEWRKTKKGKDCWWTDVTPHTCRHTWASWHYMAHRDLRTLMDLGGWKQISMVQRYTHLNTDNHASSIAALPFAGDIWGTAVSEPDIVEPRHKVTTR